MFPACKKSALCKGVRAIGKGTISGQTTTVTTTAGYLTGDLNGKTTASFLVTGKLLYEGDFTLTSLSGTLNCRITAGMLHPATGEFSNSAPITSGDGDYAGARGLLYFHGFSTDTTFVDDRVSGEMGTPKNALHQVMIPFGG